MHKHVLLKEQKGKKYRVKINFRIKSDINFCLSFSMKRILLNEARAFDNKFKN